MNGLDAFAIFLFVALIALLLDLTIPPK